MINNFYQENQYNSSNNEKSLVRNISYEMDQDKYRFLDNRGNNYICNLYGDQKPNFRFNISGFINGQERKMMKSKSLSDILISNRNKILKKPEKIYLPSLNKFEGYAPYPRPICAPFENIPTSIINKDKKSELKNSIGKNLDIKKNKTLFKKEEGNKGLSYITSNIKGVLSNQENQKTMNSDNLNSLRNYNKDKKFLLNLIDNTYKECKEQYIFSPYDKISKKQKTRALLHLKKKLMNNDETVLINGRKLEQPNTSVINEYKAIDNYLFNDYKSTNNIFNQHKNLIRSFSNIDLRINKIMNKNKSNKLNIITSGKLINKISNKENKNNSINIKNRILFSNESNKSHLNKSELSLKSNLLNISRNKITSDFSIKSSLNNKLSYIYDELETKESLSSKPWKNILFPVKSTFDENYKNENISVLSENCNNFKLNKNINFMKNIEQKMIEEKRLLVGYKKIEPKKKLKIYSKDEDGPKYKDFAEIYKKELETLEKCNPLIFKLQKKNIEKDKAKFKRKKEFKKLIEKNKMKGKSKKIKK